MLRATLSTDMSRHVAVRLCGMSQCASGPKSRGPGVALPTIPSPGVVECPKVVCTRPAPPECIPDVFNSSRRHPSDRGRRAPGLAVPASREQC